MTVTPTATPAAAPSATGTARLPQLTSDLFAFALSLRSAKDPGNAQQLFDNIARLLEQLSQRARNAGVDSAHLDAAHALPLWCAAAPTLASAHAASAAALPSAWLRPSPSQSSLVPSWEQFRIDESSGDNNFYQCVLPFQNIKLFLMWIFPSQKNGG